MSFLRSIVLAADFSEASKQAFRVACSLADEDRTRLYVIYVRDRAEATARPAAPDPSGAPREGAWVFDDDARGMLRDTYAPSKEVDVEYVLREGVVADEILRAAEDYDADLIALGTRGRSGLSRALTGSVAEAVLRRARRPVLALGSGGERNGGVIRTILHPTDFSERSEAALRVARTLARDLGARLILLHVMPVEVVVYGTVPVPLDVPAVHDSLDSVRNGVEGPDLKYRVESRLAQGNAAAVILRAAEETGSGLIVMGTHGRTGLARLLMGSVAESVLRGSKCPVLAVKAAIPAAVAEPSAQSAGA